MSSRIPPQQSTHWLASSFRARACCTQRTVARNSISAGINTRISTKISTVNAAGADRLSLHSLFFSTSSTSTTKRKSTLDAATLDSISQTLIKDLYTTQSSAKSKVTIEDVLALKPPNKVVSVDEFNRTREIVAASFNVTQLRSVLRSQNRPAVGKKSILINQVMLLMDLEVEAPKAALGVVEGPYSPAQPFTSFSSSRRELFFMLESEGDSLRRIEKEKKVRVAIDITNETYMIQGSEQSIQEAQELIQELVMVTEETWDISSYSNRDLVMKVPSALEDIARRSGTFVSAGDENTLIIAGRSDKAMEEAKRLFDLRLHESADGVEGITLFHQEDELNPVGMFPVYDSVAMTLDENQNSYFRICQTGSFADKTLDNLIIHPVQSTPSDITTLEELRKHMRGTVDNAIAPHHTLDLSAHFGQVIFLNKNHNLIQPPMPGAFDTLDLEEWLKEAVSRLPLVSLKTKTIEAEYIPSSRLLQASSTPDPALRPIRIVFALNHDGDLIIQDGRTVNRQFLANLMMLGQPTDVQIRGELATRIELESPILSELMSQTTLVSSNRLQCPNFFSFRGLSPLSSSSIPAAAQVGLGSIPTHTLRTVSFKTTGIFDYNGLSLVASDIVDQYGHVRKQELKLLPVPFTSSSLISGEGDTDAPTSTQTSSALSSSSSTSPLENWDELMKATLHFSRII
ncbi:hypothetical protein BGZ65_003974 [Modicella reniformis]|uniref:Uncharacterized protein n=1 Tax=Modicella reniformis TaxID=1440133 RepID=A0A9P6MHP0_9FUNG|nr:hypothetical protein BGZ65_003974 [Modicella reniformis]